LSRPVKSKGAPRDDVRVVLFEGERRLEDEPRFELLQSLLEGGHPVARVTAGDGSAESEGALATLALGAPPAGAKHRVDLEQTSLEDARVAVTTGREEAGLPTPGEWTPWFPVIDYKRCTNCMQCLSFCLFDVYGVDAEGQIEVRNEEKCKTNCPACSRVCPEVAILFPKYKKGPINGDVVKEEDIANESMKVDISALLGGDIYSALKDRSETARKRFSTERDESKALLERKRCLKELKESLDIPDEVLMSLPSVGEIEDRAKRAKKKMEKRRALSQTVKDQEAPSSAPSEEEWGI
jgi:NAD-dependent dihydropyrimidine dehydrogenase PreA subunit